MEWLKEILLMPFLCSVGFMAAGLIQYYFPPKKINGLYGYRTSSSMASKEKWDFAQKFSALKLIQLSVILAVLSLAGFLFSFNDGIKMFIGIGVTLLSVLVILISTENALKNKFPNT